MSRREQAPLAAVALSSRALRFYGYCTRSTVQKDAGREGPSWLRYRFRYTIQRRFVRVFCTFLLLYVVVVNSPYKP